MAEKTKEYDRITPFLIALPTWNAENREMSYEVEVIPKHIPIVEKQEAKPVETGDAMQKSLVWYRFIIFGNRSDFMHAEHLVKNKNRLISHLVTSFLNMIEYQTEQEKEGIQMGMTMTQKILAAHAGLDKVEAGQLIEADLDLVLGNDITSPVAIHEMDKMTVDTVFDKEKVALVMDQFYSE